MEEDDAEETELEVPQMDGPGKLKSSTIVWRRSVIQVKQSPHKLIQGKVID
jgi:hypothetical protein